MDSRLVPLHRAADGDADLGGKARNLGRLAAAGAPVPDGFAVPAAVVAAVVAGDTDAADAIRRAAEALGGPLAVRSSASIEDGEAGAAPGLFDSVVDVAPDALLAAIAEVAASAERPAVAAYRRRRGAGPVQLALIVQRYRRARSKGVVYTRTPDDRDADEGIVECSGPRPALARVRRADGATLERDADLPLSDQQLRALWRAARAAEDAIGAPRGADVEWVDDGEALWLVQARPIVRRPPLAPAVRELLAFSRDEPGRVWRLDATHNPDPMSPAQIGLVERVAPIAPYPMRVVGGYLYAASGAPRDAAARPPSAAELRRLVEDEVGPAIEAALAPVERAEPARIADALAAYATIFDLYSNQLSPAIARARRALPGDTSAGHHPFGRALAETAAGRRSPEALRSLLAPASPAWDVAVPTYGERPELIERAVARYRDAPPLVPSNGELADVVLELSETDDLWFFRAQAAVRRSLLALAARWSLARPDDVFFLPLAEVAAAGDRAPEDAAARAAEARARRDEQRRRAMPLAFRAGHPVVSPPPPGREVWRGRGTGGTAEGRVVRVAELGAEPVASGEEPRILVTRSVTPATLLSAFGTAAIVCEYGELLGHGAAMARELGVPCVIGCAGAWQALRDGDRVLVDGDSGLVVRLD